LKKKSKFELQKYGNMEKHIKGCRNESF